MFNLKIKIMEIKEIPLSKIKSDPKQARKTFDEKELKLLSQNILTMGVLQPITVRATQKGHIIVIGERRFRACKLANLKTIPCIIRDFDSKIINEVQIVENLQRKNIEVIEEAEAIGLLIKKYDANEIAKQLGRTSTFVHSRLKLAKLIQPFKDYVRSKDMNLSLAIRVATLTKENQEEINKSLEGSYQEYKIKSAFRNSVFNLENAPFDINNKELYAKAGACTVCPFNSINAGNLFGDNKQICSKSSCFNIKKDKGLLKLIKDAKKSKCLIIGNYYQSRRNTEEIIFFESILKENGLTPYCRDEVHLERQPILPTLEQTKIDYDHMEWSEEEIKEQLKVDLEEYKEELDTYNAALAKGYKTSLIIDAGDYKKSTMIAKLKEKETYHEASKSIDKKKMAECTPNEKIIKIKQRAQRKEHIEKNKEFVEISDIVRNSKYVQQTKTLSKEEMTAFCISLYENAIGYFDKDIIKNFYPKNNKKTPLDTIDKFHATFEKSKFNQLVRIFITKNLHFEEKNHLNDFSNIGFYKAVKPYCKKEIEIIESNYEKRKIEREEKNQKRINILKA